MCAHKRRSDCSRRRSMSSSYAKSIRSVAGLHTETLNIWSHLLGTILFSFSAVKFAATSTTPLAQDAIVIYMYLVATALCFLCSMLYHVFADHVSANTWQCIDHLGIVVFIWASSISFIFLSIHDKKDRKWTGMLFVTAAAFLSLIRLWRTFPLKSQRATVYIAFGSLATLPALHYWYCRTGVYHRVRLLTAFWSLVIVFFF